MSQNAQILKYLRPPGRTLTPLKALKLFSTWALSSRISDLNKQGAGIKTKLITRNGKTFAQYYMP